MRQRIGAMAQQQLQVAAAIALLGVAALVSADTECGSSVMFGAPWQPNNPYYIQESAWKTHGNISKLNVYVNKVTGCLQGVKPTYGALAVNARRLGTEKLPNNTPLAESDLKLQPGEYFNKVEFKFGGCITYLSLHTNKARSLTVGDPAAGGLLQTSVPDADGGFLAYFKAFTDQPMISASIGNLRQLQFIWGAKVCAPTIKPLDPYPLDPRDTAVQRPMTQTAAEQQQQPVIEEIDDSSAAGGNNSADVTAVQEPAVSEVPVPPVAAAAAAAPSPPAATSPPSAAAVDGTATSAAATAAVTDAVYCSGATCSSGTCPTSSCALNGLGKDVVTMKCFGTNIVPVPMIDLAVQNACTNLACKLDRPRCTSTGILGVGGFCTGRVVAMGAADKIHPSGKAFLGYPCMETKSLITDMVPVIGDYTAKGTYMAKAWKVCDCINGLGLVNNSIAFSTYKGGSITIIPKFPTMPQFPFIKRALINMSMPEVVAQWVVANANEAQLPKVMIDEKAADDLKHLLFNFTLPAILVPNISLPLLRLPKGFSLPVFTIPVGNKTLTKVTQIMPSLTSLPTIVVPKWSMTSFLPKLHMPEVTISNLNELADNWGVPTMPKSPPLFKMNLSDVAAQWQAANEFDLLVPKFTLPEFKIGTLKNIIPNFKVPSLVIANISVPLLHLPSPFSMPVFTLPTDNETLQAVSELFPKMNSLPHFMVPDHDFKIRIPALSLPNVTAPNFGDIVKSLGAALPKPKTPSLSSLNFTVPNFLANIPKLQLPHFPSTINFTVPGLPIPDFSGVISAVNNMPDLNLDWKHLPNALDTWKEKYLDNPAGFDWSGFVEMLKSNPIINKVADGVEMSFDVPDAIAPWVVGIAQQSQLPRLKVPKAVLKQLRKIIPGLPDAPSIVVVNITSPYLKTDAPIANLTTVVIPDEVVPQVHQLLPNFTNVPSVLIPDGDTVNVNVTLPDMAKPEVVQQLSTAAAAATPQPSANDAADTATGTTAETPASGPAAATAEPPAAAGSAATAAGTTPAAAAAEEPPAVATGPAAAASTAAAAAKAPEEMPADTSGEDDEGSQADETTTKPSTGPPAAAAATPVVTEAPSAPAATAATPASSSASGLAAPAAANDTPATETVTEVPEETVAAVPGTFTPAAAAAGGPVAPRSNQTQPKAQSAQTQKTQPKTESESEGEDVMESGMVTDDEGAWVINQNGPGIETAFMNPKEFYALDKDTQKAMKALFAI